METEKILRSKLFLYLTEFFAGMSVMAVELGASRMLAPYFSSSQIIWTIIIGTIMIALAVGNLWGGRMADKNPSPDRLYARLLVAAVWIALIPFAGRFLLAGISLLLASFLTKGFLVWASLLSCAVIFVYPLVLLGTITPSLVKYATHTLDNNGRIVGELNALNTIGSILGTFLPTFITIPYVGVAASFVIFASVLGCISLVYFLSVKRRRVLALLCALLVALSALLIPYCAFDFLSKDVVLQDESIYNYLKVQEDENRITLSTNVLIGVQSVKAKNADLTGMYYDYSLVAAAMAGMQNNSTEKSMLILGLGTGTAATLCSRYFPSVRVEGVEIDQKIAKLASTYFDMPASVHVTVADARSYLALQTKRQYDVIMVDAYRDITVPFQMSSVEFFTLVRRHLTPSGVMMLNLNMQSNRRDSINDYLCDTVASVFGTVYTVESNSNVEVFAMQGSDAIGRLQQNRQQITNPALANFLQAANEKLEIYQRGDRILTDDKAPVEVWGIQMLDDMIADEMEDYRKEIFSWIKK